MKWCVATIYLPGLPFLEHHKDCRAIRLQQHVSMTIRPPGPTPIWSHLRHAAASVHEGVLKNLASLLASTKKLYCYLNIIIFGQKNIQRKTLNSIQKHSKCIEISFWKKKKPKLCELCSRAKFLARPYGSLLARTAAAWQCAFFFRPNHRRLYFVFLFFYTCNNLKVALTSRPVTCIPYLVTKSSFS